MKRSEINTIMKDADDFIKSHGFHLPPFAYWSPEEWAAKGPEVSEIVTNNLGWDITDFGQGDYERCGLFLFTLRNGRPENLRRGRSKTYAEKIMIVGLDQITPMHFHWSKTEDIINRGGGTLVIQLFNATPDGELMDTDVVVKTDGIERIIGALNEAETAAATAHPRRSRAVIPFAFILFDTMEDRTAARCTTGPSRPVASTRRSSTPVRRPERCARRLAAASRGPDRDPRTEPAFGRRPWRKEEGAWRARSGEAGRRWTLSSSSSTRRTIASRGTAPTCGVPSAG